jgi:2-polyprenyl-6-hydroxyphenyl methylase/3-demethylubiquinone-9 3-methyltransferase
MSSVLAELGFSVAGLDVEEFSQDSLVQERSSKIGIPNHRIVDLEQGEFALEKTDFDLVLFTETLEHLPFHPKKMWLRLFSLLRSGGRIYLTTPNSLSLRKLPMLLAKLFLRVGWGPSLKQILGKPNFGTHWKEYSARELKHYFPMLGMDAKTSIAFYRYNPILRSGSLIDWGGAFCNLCAECIPPLREEMEIWITPIETG